MRLRLLTIVLLVLLVPATAHAKGFGGAATEGVVVPGDPDRYTTVQAAGGTVVTKTRRAGGQVVGSRRLRGRFDVPAVSLDGAGGGLAADGRSLVLAQQLRRFPPRASRFLILDRRLRVRERLTFRGHYAFDAISPDGRFAFFVQYLSEDGTRYAVRVYDRDAGRLLRDPVVDKREPDEQMAGWAMSRAMSPDGRWAYTLYQGAAGHDFVHALDTVARAAFCVDLPGRLRDQPGLQLGGGTLTVSERGTPRLLVDTRTFEVSAPRPARAPAADGGGAPWLPIGAAAAALLLLLGASLRRGRARRGPTGPATRDPETPARALARRGG